MNRKSFFAVLVTGLITLGLVLGFTTGAQAAVKARDLPSKTQIVKIYKNLRGAEFATAKGDTITVPAQECGTTRTVGVNSTRSRAGVAQSGPSVVAAVVQFKSKRAAKRALRKQKRYINRCDSFEQFGMSVKISRNKAPKLGQDRVMMTAVTSTDGYRGFATSVIIRHGKRLASVAASDDRKVSKKKVRRLAKIAARRMR